MALPSAPPPGVFVPIPTFFKAHASSSSDLQPALDPSTQLEHAIHLARSGITGIVPLGSTGEAVHLSRSERFSLVSSLRKGLTDAGFPEYPIMAGVLANGIDEVLESLEDMKRAGAQWGMVLAPGYFGAGVQQERVREWYEAVAGRAGIPILIYNFPGVTNGLLLHPPTYRALAAHPNIVGAKMSHGNVSYHVQVSLDPEIDHAQFRVFSGFGAQLGPIVLFDAAGVIDGLAAYFPKTVCLLYKLSAARSTGGSKEDEEKRWAKMKELQYLVARGEEWISKTGMIGIKDAVKRVLGMGTLEGGRLPLRGTVPEGTWKEWADVHGRLQQMEDSIDAAKEFR